MAAIELRGISKRFGEVVANHEIDLAVARGEIVALLGENGAGKSTLMNILYGLLQPDAGEILINDRPARLASPLDAIRAGLGMVHQHFKLFPSLTVAENVVFAKEPRRRLLLDRAEAQASVVALSRRYGLDVDPDAQVGSLPVGVRQRVEILKLLYRSAEVLILDEPTAVLTPGERTSLFAVLRRLKDQGKAIIFITHKLDEVMALSDRVVVMRDGRVVGSFITADTTADALVSAMVGRDLDWRSERPRGNPGKVLLEVSALRVPGRGAESVMDVSLAVRSGEILGIAGVAGNGQSALIEALTGVRPATAGTIAIAGRDITALGVAERRRAGLAYIPGDRHHVGLAMGATVHDNLAMGHHRTRSGWLVLRRRVLAAFAGTLARDYGVKVSNLAVAIDTLSGGNQQKVVVARELTKDASVLIVEHPTRGVDIGAVAFIHGELCRYRDTGHAVLLVSSELTEILALADRIAVMYEGRIVGEMPAQAADEATLGRLMAGGGAP